MVCPWCYIGKRRLETRAGGLRARATTSRSSTAPSSSTRPRRGCPSRPSPSTSGAKYGGGPAAGQQMVERTEAVAAEEGLLFRLGEAQRVNTVDAHRLLHLALETGGPELQARAQGGAARGVLPAGARTSPTTTSCVVRRSRSASTPRPSTRSSPATATPTPSSTTSARRPRSARPACRSSSSTASTASRAPSRPRSSARCSTGPGTSRTRGSSTSGPSDDAAAPTAAPSEPVCPQERSTICGPRGSPVDDDGILWTTRRPRENSSKMLVDLPCGERFAGIELLSRTSSGESGITRSRRSIRRGNPPR